MKQVNNTTAAHHGNQGYTAAEVTVRHEGDEAEVFWRSQDPKSKRGSDASGVGRQAFS